jgi:sterol desaturase/sphingolipid hydroxylase (fatty acid hydroxylase superfamily)
MSHGGPGGARDYVFDRTRADEERRLEKQYMTRYSPTRLAQGVPIPLLGYPPTIVAAYVPLLSFDAVFLHANVSWDLGPLGLVNASPAFHRWHHAREAAGHGRNFAGLFPFIDAVFGTLYLPRGCRPEQFGIAGDPVPAGLIAQLRYPFSRTRRVEV